MEENSTEGIDMVGNKAETGSVEDEGGAPDNNHPINI